MSVLVIALLDGDVPPPGVTIVAHVSPVAHFEPKSVNPGHGVATAPAVADHADMGLTLSLQEAGSLLGGISESTVKRLVANGELPYIQVGKRRRIARHDLEQYVVTHRRAAGDKGAA